MDIVPAKWTKQGEPVLSPTTEIYVAGDRDSFAQWAEDFARDPNRLPEAIQRIESVRAPLPGDRLRNLQYADVTEEGILVELVLHARAHDEYIVAAFEAYSRELGIELDTDRRLYAGGLCFLPAAASSVQLDALTHFAFLRAARPLSKMRHLMPIERAVQAGASNCPLPVEGPKRSDLRVAVFDGGLKPGTALDKWATSIDAPGVGESEAAYLEHGHSVTSALLFGSLEPGVEAEQPHATIDHYRVLDASSDGDPFELYDVLRRIDDVLSDKSYEFINLSLGPYSSVEDDDVHPWTAVLDAYLAEGKALAAIAVGNNGMPNADPAEQRIQVPADCVNGFAVGAADSTRDGWKRSAYSALGPGRSPGLVKPDALEFGGSNTEPFVVYSSSDDQTIAHTQGTSFASPAALRRAVAMRTHFGDRLSPLALKALLIHSAGDGGHERADVGWGRIPGALEDIMVCGDGEVRVVYQGELTPGRYLRAQIPMPDRGLSGKVKIAATFTYATLTDPQDPGNYTRSGLVVTFRPHDQKFAKDDALDPQSKPFFKKTAFDTEGTLRGDAQKWETVLNREQGFMAKSLRNPVFDIHYNARTNGGQAIGAERIRYALVVTVTSPRTPDLYDQVVRTYAGRLEALRPVIELPIQI
ncbi:MULTISPECIES: S8 family peptidase [Paenarthrobacter]|uniref:S8 family peptidase n=1 Tax=Paenarthrobacter TaxID=1742992 RepID=UPI00117F05D4|nr:MULTISPECIES: S8 family peptidase [Paenarthrobacter]MCY0975534.1 S8 family peptidase [Paenarthrobacter ureafaciens]